MQWKSRGKLPSDAAGASDQSGFESFEVIGDLLWGSKYLSAYAYFPEISSFALHSQLSCLCIQDPLLKQSM